MSARLPPGGIAPPGRIFPPGQVGVRNGHAAQGPSYSPAYAPSYALADDGAAPANGAAPVTSTKPPATETIARRAGAMVNEIDFPGFVAQLVHGIQATALQPLLPWVAARSASKQSASDRLLMRVAIFGGVGCMVVPLIFIVFADSILSFWIGTAFSRENSDLCRILMGAYGLLAFNIPVHYLLLGLGSVRFLAATNIAAGAVSLGASLLLSPLGLTYLALGKLCFAPLILFNFVMLRENVRRSKSERTRPAA